MTDTLVVQDRPKIQPADEGISTDRAPTRAAQIIDNYTPLNPDNLAPTRFLPIFLAALVVEGISSIDLNDPKTKRALRRIVQSLDRKLGLAHSPNTETALLTIWSAFHFDNFDGHLKNRKTSCINHPDIGEPVVYEINMTPYFAQGELKRFPERERELIKELAMEFVNEMRAN